MEKPFDCSRLHHYMIGLGAIALGIILTFSASRYRNWGILVAITGGLLFLDDYKDYEKCG